MLFFQVSFLAQKKTLKWDDSPLLRKKEKEKEKEKGKKRKKVNVDKSLFFLCKKGGLEKQT